MSAPQSSLSSDEIMGRVRRELQEQQMEDLVNALAEKCFAKCVKKPGPSLSTAEQHCIVKAMDRYLEVMTVVFRTLAQKGEEHAASS